jgi:hypothetical protein
MNYKVKCFQMTLFVSIFGTFLIAYITGCGNNQRKEQAVKMKTDITELSRLMNLPGKVDTCEWQTGDYPSGRDWWVVAILNIDGQSESLFLQGSGNEEYIETPPALQLDSSFAALKSMPGAQIGAKDVVRIVTKTYSATPYLSPPLNNGKVIRLSDNQILVFLWTN